MIGTPDVLEAVSGFRLCVFPRRPRGWLRHTRTVRHFVPVFNSQGFVAIVRVSIGKHVFQNMIFLLWQLRQIPRLASAAYGNAFVCFEPISTFSDYIHELFWHHAHSLTRLFAWPAVRAAAASRVPIIHPAMLCITQVETVTRHTSALFLCF